MMKRKRARISLRILLALMVGLLAAIALGFAIQEQRDSRAVLIQAERMQARNRPVDICLQVVNNFIAERGHSIAGLLGAGPLDDTHRAFLAERRQAMDESIGQVLALVPEDSRDKAKEVKLLWEQLRSIRPELDRALYMPQAQRDPDLAGHWLALANNFVDSLLAMIYMVTDYPSIEDIGLDYLNNLQATSTLFSTMITAELGIFRANSMSGRAFNPREIAALSVIRHQSSRIWERLIPGVQRIGDAKITAALERLKASPVDELRARQEEILVAAERGGFVADGGSLQRYVVVSMTVAKEAGELGDSLRSLKEKYTRSRIEQARERTRMAWVGIAATLLLGALSFALFAWRVAWPLQVIQRRIDLLIKRQSGNFLQTALASEGDELDRANSALQLLDEAMDARIRSDEALREHEGLSASILKAVPQAIIVTNTQGVIMMFSPGAEAMLGYSASEVVGLHSPMLFHDEKEIHVRAEELTKELGVPVKPDREVFLAKYRLTEWPEEHEWTYIRKDGSRITVLLSVAEVKGLHGNSYGCGVATDITERSQLAAEMSRLANYDPLTQLPNRRLFQDRIRMAITQARRESTYLALMVIDIDRFKPVNDQYGHSVGDLLLKAIAGRMQGCLRESDTLARVGGDEFVVILPVISNSQDAMGVADKIRLSVCQPFELQEDITVSVDCSIGIAIYPDHGASEEGLLKNADNAMYVAKALGRAQVHMASEGDGHGAGIASGAHGRDHRGGPITKLVWRRSYQCGDPTIDREHRDLFTRGNAIIHAVANEEIPPEKLPEMMDELIALVVEHFRNEEQILATHGYDGLKEHILQHRKLIRRAREMREMAVANELSVENVVTFLTRDIVAEHMLIDDYDYFRVLKKDFGND